MPEIKKSWKKFSICIDLDSQWPSKIVVNKDIFRLHTVPMENLTNGATVPIIYDGTKESFLISHPELGKGYKLQSIKGVYRIEQNAMIPLKAGILSGGEGSYEIEQKPDKNGKTEYWLNLHYPKAFSDPVTIVVDAVWYQPAFSKMISDQLKALPYSRDIVGVNWEIGETVIPHRENNFHDDMDGFMHLLTIKNKSILSFEDISSLLEMFGSVWKGYFRPVKDLFYDVEIEHVPAGKDDLRGTLKFVYYLKFYECEAGMVPLIEVFTEQVGKILDSWISEAVIETKMEIGQGQ
jgi:type VI secretion system protein ImpG